jgi:hypothetical protein
VYYAGISKSMVPWVCLGLIRKVVTMPGFGHYPPSHPSDGARTVRRPTFAKYAYVYERTRAYE